MDLDNEELKATRKLNTKEIEKNSGIKEKQEKSSCIEKLADEMFEELDYRKNEDERVIIYDYIQYFNHFRTFKKISFYKLDKGISLYNYNITEEMKIDYNLTMQELKAINKKCKELGWL